MVLNQLADHLGWHVPQDLPVTSALSSASLHDNIKPGSCSLLSLLGPLCTLQETSHSHSYTDIQAVLTSTWQSYHTQKTLGSSQTQVLPVQDPSLRSEEISVHPAQLCWSLQGSSQQNQTQTPMYQTLAQQDGLFLPSGTWLAGHGGSAEKIHIFL